MINERVRELRGDMTRKQFAELCGITEKSISNYERGERTPDADALIKISRGTGASTDYILGISDTVKQVKAPDLDPDRAATADLLAARFYELAALDQNAGYDRNCLPVYALILQGLISLATDANQWFSDQRDKNPAFTLSGIGDLILSADDMEQIRDQKRAFEDAILKMSAGAGIIINRMVSSQLAARLIGQEIASKDLIDRSDEIIAQAYANIVNRQ